MIFIKTLLLSLIMIFSVNSYAQDLRCSTNQDTEFMKRLQRNVDNSFIQKALVARFIPVELHLVADNDGSLTITEDEVINKMCVINNTYADFEMHFYIAGINIINNTNLNHRQSLQSSLTLIRNNKNQNAMNIFFVNEILENDFGPTGAAGYYSGGNNDFIVMRQTGGPPNTLEHEIGHHFSLSHTHYGWEGDISNGSSAGGYDPLIHGDTVLIEVITGSTQAPDVEVELVDGSNCTTAGDRICDTPPDYGFGQACSCCTMRWDVWDRNFDKIEPMLENIMSYSNDCAQESFTDGQRDAMVEDFDSPFRAHLRVAEVTEYTPITEEVAITSPQVADKFDNFDGVLIEWDAVQHAETYVVNISGGQQLSYETSDTEMYIDELQPSSLYFVDVKAFNKFGTGCQNSIRVFFETGAGSTSTNETESINDINIYPNPVKNTEDLVIDYNSDKNIASKIRLHNLQGKVVELINTTFAAGNNKFTINTTSLVSGLYILEIETAEGIISEKIIVE